MVVKFRTNYGKSVLVGSSDTCIICRKPKGFELNITLHRVYTLLTLSNDTFSKIAIKNNLSRIPQNLYSLLPSNLLLCRRPHLLTTSRN